MLLLSNVRRVTRSPRHVAEVRRLVFDALTRAQVGQLRGIGQRINGAIGCDGEPGEHGPPVA